MKSSYNISDKMSDAVKRSIKESGIDVKTIADDMSHMLNKKIPASTVYNWASNKKPDHQIRADFLLAFCLVTQKRYTLDVIISVLRMEMLYKNIMANCQTSKLEGWND
jgi:hypothetical protein